MKIKMLAALAGELINLQAGDMLDVGNQITATEATRWVECGIAEEILEESGTQAAEVG